MPPDDELLTFFKALADANRLRIVGLLARGPESVEALATALDLRPSTVSHHLAKLAEAGLVLASVDGHYHVYRLSTDTLHAMAKRLASPEPLSVEVDSATDAWDRKVIATFAGPDGRFEKLPMQRKKLEAILRHVSRGFQPGVIYTNKQINDALRVFSDDTAALRRGLVDHRMMARDPDGSRWWLLPAPAAD